LVRLEQGLAPLLLGFDERGQAPLPDLFFSYFYNDPFVLGTPRMRLFRSTARRNARANIKMEVTAFKFKE
jgi:hypothetical protein